MEDEHTLYTYVVHMYIVGQIVYIIIKIYIQCNHFIGDSLNYNNLGDKINPKISTFDENPIIDSIILKQQIVYRRISV